VVGFRDYPHGGQETNAAIESFHNFLKSHNLKTKNFLQARRIDWLAYVLLDIIMPHYQQKAAAKNLGFSRNINQEKVTLGALKAARKLSDAVVVINYADATATVQGSTGTVHTVEMTKWIGCSCMKSAQLVRFCFLVAGLGERSITDQLNSQHLQGLLCSHQVKSWLQVPGVTEDSIYKFCGSNFGGAYGGVEKLFAEAGRDNNNNGTVTALSSQRRAVGALAEAPEGGAHAGVDSTAAPAAPPRGTPTVTQESVQKRLDAICGLVKVRPRPFAQA